MKQVDRAPLGQKPQQAAACKGLKFGQILFAGSCCLGCAGPNGASAWLFLVVGYGSMAPRGSPRSLAPASALLRLPVPSASSSIPCPFPTPFVSSYPFRTPSVPLAYPAGFRGLNTHPNTQRHFGCVFFVIFVFFWFFLIKSRLDGETRDFLKGKIASR